MRQVTTPASFLPGDFGRLLNNGMLVIAGRSTEVINVGGNKISPDRFENILMQCDGVRDAAVFTVDIKSALPQVWAAIVADSDRQHGGSDETLLLDADDRGANGDQDRVGDPAQQRGQDSPRPVADRADKESRLTVIS